LYNNYELITRVVRKKQDTTKSGVC